MRFIGLGLLSVAVVAGAAVAQETALWKEDVAGWEILVDQSLDDGCFMITEYERGTLLRAQFNPAADTFQFVVGDPNWKSIEENKFYEIEVEFGSAGPWTGDAVGYDFGGINALILHIPFEDDRADLFIEEFMRYTVVDVRYEGSSIARLSLKGTYAAMEEVMACQAAMLDQPAPAQDDPFSGSSSRGSDPFE